LNDAVKIAEELAGLEHYRIVKLPKLKDPFEELMSGFSTKMKMRVIESEMGMAARYYHVLENIKNSNGIMARVPYNVTIE